MPKEKSPLYNYKSPRDYPVFNMGNKASPPFKMKYSNSAFPFKSPVKNVIAHANGMTKSRADMLQAEHEKTAKHHTDPQLP